MTTYLIIGAVAVLAVLLCFGLAVASFAPENFYEKLEENRAKRNSAGISTLDFVRAVNEQAFDSRLKIARCAEYDDHYSTGVVALSSQTMASNSLASLATVAHELGHARQDASGDTLKRHWRMKRRGRICGLFFMPVVLAGIALSLLYLFSILPQKYILIIGLALMALGVVIFCFAVFLKINEIKIEKEASRFALEFLQNLLTNDELKDCKEFLDSAAYTYWAVLFRTLLGWTFLTGKNKMFE